MSLDELMDYQQTLCINHFTDRLDFPTNTNESKRKWYKERFKAIKEAIKLKEQEK